MVVGPRRIADRISTELIHSSAQQMFPPPTALGASSINFRRVESLDNGVVTWGPNRVIGFRYSPQDPNDGVDNDGHGMIDDGEIVPPLNPNLPDEQTFVLASKISEFFTGELDNRSAMVPSWDVMVLKRARWRPSSLLVVGQTYCRATFTGELISKST